MKQNIYIQQWLELKPYKTQIPTDRYYLEISNKVNIILTKEPILKNYLSEKEICLFAVFLASYLEDLVSETNIWNTFVKCHTKLYQKKLPFFDTSSYYDNEVNEQDISFLIWYFLNSAQENKFINPYNDFIANLASKIYDLFDAEFEFAPENPQLKPHYQLKKNETDYFIARKMIDNLLFDTYLFYPDTGLKLKRQEREILKTRPYIKDGDMDINTRLNELRADFLHSKHTRLLSFTGKEWAAALLGNQHPLSASLNEMSQRIYSVFLYKGQDKKDIFLEHIATSKKFNLTKKSFDASSSLTTIDTILFIGIVLWQNEWWFSGTCSQMGFDQSLVLEEKKSTESKIAVSFLDKDNADTVGLLKKQLDAFLAFNNQSLIAFLPSDQINSFMKEYTAYYNDSLNLSDEKIQESEDRAKKAGFSKENKVEEVDFSEDAEMGLIFFNEKSGLEIALNVNNAFPDEKNLSFIPAECEKSVVQLFMSNQLSPELALYCVNQYKNKFSFLEDGLWKMYLLDLDFLLRYWKNKQYHSAPSVSYLGD